MTGLVPPSGPLKMSDINTAWALGNDIARYHGVKYYKPASALFGSFSNNTISFSDFYGSEGKVTQNITIASDTQNLTVNPASVTNYIAAFSQVNITVNSGIYLGSSSTAAYALTITGFVAGDVVNLTNNGYILGAVGSGGNGGSGGGGATGGSAGGNAILLTLLGTKVNITNNGTIAGGGGGGGADNGGTTYGSCFGGGGSFSGGSGSGGAGYTTGAGGSGGANGGNPGTRLAGGAPAGNGGAAGGDLGASGSSSGNGTGGGSGGFYIVGGTNANFITNGTLLGKSG
jgi:hypothetical protein